MGFHLLPLIQKMKLYSHLNSAISTNQIQNIKKKKKKKTTTELSKIKVEYRYNPNTF